MTTTATTAAPRVLRLCDVMERTGLRRDTVYRLGRRGTFPKPIKLTDRASGWLASEIDAWIESRAAARDSDAGEPEAA